MSTATIQPERILRDLGELWTTLGKEGEHEQGVLRACAMTLLVLADASEDPAEIGETLAALMKEHPSRAIVIRVDDKSVLGAQVLAQCWMPFGSRRQICCEQIEISASASDLSDLPAIVLPLAVADLPVIVWCRLRTAASEPFARLATKTIIDTAVRPDLEALVAAFNQRRLMADLTWTRLTRWRELIAQIFENPAYAGSIPFVQKIRIVHTGTARPVSAWYMAAWLLDC
ncbi:MAG: glucose-6-phosphate dehydrogenase assembly protein OpcA, partial [Phycisphaerales bacterium]|nr:glucose-6-phosphate dehydrogenase assembly protein OpcA [Phycisphaerales bacterium]